MNIKGFDKNLCCRGMQFELGKEYQIEKYCQALQLCTDTVFHYCKSIEDVIDYYPVCESSRYCEIEVLGSEVSDGHKYGSDHIRILREIKGNELKSLFGIKGNNTGYWCKSDYNTGMKNSGLRNTGDNNLGSLNAGDSNFGCWNTGDWNNGEWNSGNHNFGNHNSGNENLGNSNTGDRNSGCRNTGDRNSGHRNTGCNNSGMRNVGDGNTEFYNSGYQNAGHNNTGNCNSGSFNTGGFNSADYCSGFFCTEEDPEIRLFNKPSGMTQKQFRTSVYWEALHSVALPLTLWEDNPIDGGNLNCKTYKEACQIWWKKLTNKNRNIILSMPNFDAKIFMEITGIEIDDNYGEC